jgi:prephenate dehydratase
MIIRLIALDPRPRDASKTDIVVYQVPEKSRELELLMELFDQHGIEYTTLESNKRRRKA